MLGDDTWLFLVGGAMCLVNFDHNREEGMLTTCATPQAPLPLSRSRQRVAKRKKPPGNLSMKKHCSLCFYDIFQSTSHPIAVIFKTILATCIVPISQVDRLRLGEKWPSLQLLAEMIFRLRVPHCSLLLTCHNNVSR